jgi:propanediol utilization protein
MLNSSWYRVAAPVSPSVEALVSVKKLRHETQYGCHSTGAVVQTKSFLKQQQIVGRCKTAQYRLYIETIDRLHDQCFR